MRRKTMNRIGFLFKSLAFLVCGSTGTVLPISVSLSRMNSHSEMFLHVQPNQLPSSGAMMALGITDFMPAIFGVIVAIALVRYFAVEWPVEFRHLRSS